MIKISIFKRLLTVYKIIGQTFGTWISPIITGFLLLILRIVVFIGSIFDYIFYSKIRNGQIKNPIIIVGNPRSGTTFLHHYLTSHKLGTGSQLWQMLYPTVVLQKIIRPFLPFLEKISPTRHHSTDAHKTSLQSVETDDASILFRYLDGFFLYGFLLSWNKNNLFDWVDPKKRDTSSRDFDWLESMWLRVLVSNNQNQIIGKLFSISANMPKFLHRFPNAKILYMVRDPLSVIPSGLSLVTGVLDKKFGFWSLEKEKRDRFIKRLYGALIELLKRFHSDWTSGKIDKNKVMIVHFDRMMGDFDGLMNDIIDFIEIEPSEDFKNDIKITAEKQRNFKSKHKYDLSKFGLTEQQIKDDCQIIYDTFLNANDKN
ncbi:sulfotransferase [bacterium]|nr:MAG: hypothetical protein CBB66_03710 [bacterium TMED6]RCL86817.1 MAG: sulfotransferase [bacterium]|tara:strand:- start:9341 stop:10453 length:1113 start_codon:yes stop_codon:yes gene_type:complete